MRKYEVVVLLQADAGEKAISDQLNLIFKKCDVKVLEKEDWGQKKLWHPIKKIENVYYKYSICEIAPDKVKDLEKEFFFTPMIHRGFIVTFDKEAEKRYNAIKAQKAHRAAVKAQEAKEQSETVKESG